jgi:hypothetical protein
MISVNGYIDGNTLIATDDALRNFRGKEILIRILPRPVKKPSLEDKRLEALDAISGILNQSKPMTMADIRAERLGL